MTPPPKRPHLPLPRTERLQLARNPTSIDADPTLYHSIHLSKHHTQRPLPSDLKDETPEKTVLYLAYGSNLSIEKFRGDRGIEPLSQVNVYVPALRLTFDLAGIPYLEPCYSGTRYRTSEDDDAYAKNHQERYRDVVDEKETVDTTIEEQPDLESGYNDQGHGGYHKDQWHKPLIGVVYEVTLTDYAHIIATEGGGNGYVDIVTECFPFPADEDYNPNDPTPDVPEEKAFMAHTLLSPPRSAYRPNSHIIRPDPSYAQPSARYLKLITDGAEELNFPYDYRAYLASIRSYKVTTSGQRVGQKIAVYVLIPLLQIFIALGQLLADEDGIIPSWLARMFDAMRELMWMVYDVVGVKVLGDGERSVDDM